MDIDALVAEHYATKPIPDGTTTAATQEPPAKAETVQRGTSPVKGMNSTVGALSFSASLRALAVSPALPGLVQKLATLVETLERRGS